MTVKITSKDIRITPDIEQTAEKKITQRLKKHSQKQGEDQPVVVKASEKKPFTRVDVDMPYLNYQIHAEAVTADGILGGIDKCMDILERQIDKYKTRMHRSRVKGSGLKKDILDIVTDDELMGRPAPDAGDEPDYKVIKAEGKPQPMSIDEAILQMEVLEYKFLFFLNAETEAASVVYRRDDGNIGLINA
ncbi:MAG: ribosome-associated translation inhibitor RaiA [Oscillospiraceae bacterium]|jgi:putative sigma-54 modulation protein|nr:ribosome-associated translation inhibitor RaiA [Oscillospiraceae bacterium]